MRNVSRLTLTVLSMAMANAVFASGGTVITRSLELDYRVEGFTETVEEVLLGEPVSLADVTYVLIEPITVERFGEGGAYEIRLFARFLDGDEVVFEGVEPFGLNFATWTDVHRLPISVRTQWQDRQVDRIQFVHSQTSEGASALTTWVRGHVGDDRFRVHFVRGAFGSEGPNFAQPLSVGAAVRVDGTGVSPWQYAHLTTPLPADDLRLVFTTGEPLYDWRLLGGGMTEAEILFDDPLQPPVTLGMDDMFSPSIGQFRWGWISAEHSLLIDDATRERIRGHEIVACRWRLRFEGTGWMQIDRFWPDLRFAYQRDASATPFLRGEVNDDSAVDISDSVFILEWIFLGAQEPGCVAAANANGDAEVDISDPIWLLEHEFLGGPAPVEPFGECGPGTLPSDEEHGCATPPAACE